MNSRAMSMHRTNSQGWAGWMAVTHHSGSTPGTYYTHHNHRGDIVLTRSGTTTIGRYDYSAFGVPRFALGPDVCRLQFSSKERDPATGWRDYGFRYYAPQWQRWPNRDPIGEADGLNLFQFANNQPSGAVDPNGLAKLPLGGLSGSYRPPTPVTPQMAAAGFLSAAGALVGAMSPYICHRTCAESGCKACCVAVMAVGTAVNVGATAATGWTGFGLFAGIVSQVSVLNNFLDCLAGCEAKAQ
jgi:RHS repeat-associated protein